MRSTLQVEVCLTHHPLRPEIQIDPLAFARASSRACEIESCIDVTDVAGTRASVSGRVAVVLQIVPSDLRRSIMCIATGQ